MLQIGNTLVSLDLVERYFCCDLEACHGACCIEGDAGAPVTEAEAELLRQSLPVVLPRLSRPCRRAIEDGGVAYTDADGDLVTTLVDGCECAFSFRGEGGVCLCAVDDAFRRGLTTWRKPISCYLYPARITEYPNFTAVNYHRWDICRPAEALGKQKGIRVYQYLREPLIERFGAEWYAELCEAAEAYLAEYGN